MGHKHPSRFFGYPRKEYYLGNSMKVNAEVKYQSNIDWVTIGVGIAYVF